MAVRFLLRGPALCSRARAVASSRPGWQHSLCASAGAAKVSSSTGRDWIKIGVGATLAVPTIAFAYWMLEDDLATTLAVDAALRGRMPVAQADEERIYVERPELEDELKRYLDGPERLYLVVAGMRGAGKSTTVQHVLHGREGVVYVSVSEDLKVVPARLVLSELQTSLRFSRPLNSLVEKGTDKHIATIFKRAAAKHRRVHPDTPQWQPVLVYDVKGHVSGSTVTALAKHLKELMHDLGCGRGILVLSDAFAVSSLPTDRSRQLFVRVDDMPLKDAKALLIKRLAAVGVTSPVVQQEAAEHILPLTTRASDLTKSALAVGAHAEEKEQRLAVHTAVDLLRSDAAQDVKETLKIGDTADKHLRGEQGFHVHRLMAELLRTGRPVSINDTKYLEGAQLFAAKVRASENAKVALKVDLVNRTVDFGTAAHRSAAAEILEARGEPNDGFSTPKGFMAMVWGSIGQSRSWMRAGSAEVPG